MLTKSKFTKFQTALKNYNKKYLHGKLTELDESGTRLMVNSFLIDVLGFAPIEEVKTEYMIRGTYADYVIQTKATRHFLVEVKALSFALSEKHLRQAINYGANEGIEWAMLTNGKCFDFYKILFEKPIDSRLVFSFDLSKPTDLKNCEQVLQLLHKDAITNKGLEVLWNKTTALDSNNVAGILLAPTVTNFVKKTLVAKYKSKFSDDEIKAALLRVFNDKLTSDNIKPMKAAVKKVVAKPSASN